MVGKMLLPYLGGAPVVWNTCMVFYQLMLLGGYAYADLLSQQRGQVLKTIHFLVLAIPLLILPITLSEASIELLSNGAEPVPWLLKVLFLGTGIPFFVVATSNPLLQSWFSKSGHSHSRDPYFLNIASNSGSLLGLLSYPFIWEPLLSLSDQRKFWAMGYGLFALLVAFCLISAKQAGKSVSSKPPFLRSVKVSWFVLSLLPSSLMLGVTTYLTTEVGGFPLLWVVPLCLYLLSFILVFSHWGEALTRWASRWLGLLVLALILTILLDAAEPAAVVIPIHLCTFFVASLFCHGRLALDRPPAERLTSFYLAMSIGGVLGGVVNALLAPIVFSSVLEYPLVLLLVCLFRFPFETSKKRNAIVRRSGLWSWCLFLDLAY